MNEIIILFLIFGTLFIMEKKSINILAYYIGMVIIIAIVISNTPYVNEINKNLLNTIPIINTSNIITPHLWMGEGEINEQNNIYNIGYISYILILVQISALTILFGFIIMLFPNNNTDILINKKNIITTIKTNKQLKKNNNIIILILSIIILILSYKLIISTEQNSLRNEILYNMILEIFTPGRYTNYEINKIPEMENTTSIFIKKISELIYSDISNIIKFMVITIILLFAIIGLFYILLPTYI